MRKKSCGSLSGIWWNFEVSKSLCNILLAFLAVALLPFAFVYVKNNNLIYYIKNR